MSWIIYGKIVKSIPLPDGKGGKHIKEPQTTFRALNSVGQRVSRVNNAKQYEDKESAQKIVKKAQLYWERQGYKDYILFEIRKKK